MTALKIEIGTNWDHEGEKRRVIRKIDIHLLPLLSILCLLSHLNKSNIANAKLGGLERDLQLTHEQYQWCLSIFFLGFVLFQIPSSIILRRWGSSKWISSAAFIWGTVAISMAAVEGYKSLLLCRFLLGALQCGFFPAFIYYTSLWYRRKEQALRLGFIWSSSALAGAFGGLLAYAVGHFESTLFAQWQLIFIVQGLPTIVLAILCWFYLPYSPEHAWFLTVKERQLAVDLLAHDADASHSHSFSWAQVRSVFMDWKTFAFAIIHINGVIPLQGITFFLPMIIHGMGRFTAVQTQLMTTPPYLVAFVFILVASRSSDRFMERSFHLLLTNLCSIYGLLILILVDQSHANVRYLGVILVTSGVYASVGIRLAWINNNFASLTRRAIASALIISLSANGGLISGHIYHEKQKPQYVLGSMIALSCILVQSVFILGLRIVFMSINYRRSRMNEEEVVRQIQRYGGNDLVGDRHPRFRYTL